MSTNEMRCNQEFSGTSHISSAQRPPVTSDTCAGQCGESAPGTPGGPLVLQIPSRLFLGQANDMEEEGFGFRKPQLLSAYGYSRKRSIAFIEFPKASQTPKG